MLELSIPAARIFNESTLEFIDVPECTLHMEYSLVALSKWEMKYQKPFLKKEPRTRGEMLYLYKCMTLNEVPDATYAAITQAQRKKIEDYINNPMSATTITRAKNGKHSGSDVTSELIYYWMSAAQLPVEYENWHLNRLMKLLEVASIKSQPPKKMSRREALARQRALNEKRKARLGSRG